MKYKLLVVGFLGAALLLPVASQAQSVSELQAMLQDLLRQVAELQARIAASGGQPAEWCHTFGTNLRVGDSGADVTALKTALSKEGFNTGGSAQFDEVTASAIVQFQEKYQNEVLGPHNLTRGTGYVGATTRAKLNRLYGCVTGGHGPDRPGRTPSVDLRVCREKCSNGPVTQEPGYSTFRWTSQNADSCSASGDPLWSGTKSASGSETVWTGNEKTGTTTYSLTCTNQSANTSASDRVTVSFRQETNPSPSITVVSPNGGERLRPGQDYNITWRAAGVVTVKMELCGYSKYLGPICKGLAGSAGVGLDAAQGSYLWHLDPNHPYFPGDLKIKISAADPQHTNVFDESDATFFVGDATDVSVDYVQSPAGDRNVMNPGERVVVYGKNLNVGNVLVRMIGKAEDRTMVTFNAYSGTTNFTAPTVSAGEYDLFLEQNGRESNKIKVTVTAPSVPNISISYVQSPAEDRNVLHAGERAVVYGTHLNNGALTVVRMIGKAEDKKAAVFDVHDGDLSFTVPSVANGDYDLSIEQVGAESNKIRVVVR